jgi:hypothetical protein
MAATGAAGSPTTTGSIPIPVHHDPTLEALLVTNPVPGWTPVPDRRSVP